MLLLQSFTTLYFTKRTCKARENVIDNTSLQQIMLKCLANFILFIFLFSLMSLARLFHSYRDEPIGRWETLFLSSMYSNSYSNWFPLRKLLFSSCPEDGSNTNLPLIDDPCVALATGSKIWLEQNCF